VNWEVPLCQPRLDEAELDAVVKTYRSGWLSAGPRTEELEGAFRAYTGARHALALSSCSAALHLASLGAGFGPGDRVVVPSLTFVSTVSAVAHTGAIPIFADIAGPTEPWLSAAAVADSIDEHTRGIVTVAYGGHPGEVAEIAAIAAQRGIALIEDVAHACGSRLKSRHAGTFGLAGAFSFSASKNIGIGEGGLLVTDDEELARGVSHGRWHGIGSSIWDRHRQSAPQYELGELGFNYRFDDPRATLVLARLRRLDADNRRRAAIDAFYREALASLEQIEPTVAPPRGEDASHCLFTAVLDESVDRDEFRTALAKRGVQTSVHYPPAHMSGAHARAGVHLPLTEDYARRSVTLPMFPHMEGRQQELVVESVASALHRPARARAVA
jgi:dTDP-4-amino-4,6-dideoxygalactose transaminase